MVNPQFCAYHSHTDPNMIICKSIVKLNNISISIFHCNRLHDACMTIRDALTVVKFAETTQLPDIISKVIPELLSKASKCVAHATLQCSNQTSTIDKTSDGIIPPPVRFVEIPDETSPTRLFEMLASSQNQNSSNRNVSDTHCVIRMDKWEGDDTEITLPLDIQAATILYNLAILQQHQANNIISEAVMHDVVTDNNAVARNKYAMEILISTYKLLRMSYGIISNCWHVMCDQHNTVLSNASRNDENTTTTSSPICENVSNHLINQSKKTDRILCISILVLQKLIHVTHSANLEMSHEYRNFVHYLDKIKSFLRTSTYNKQHKMLYKESTIAAAA
jgi:hypothetical protein